MGLLAADAAVVNIVDCLLVGDEMTKGDVAERLLDESGRRCLAERGRSNMPPLFLLLLFRGGTIVVQQAIVISVCVVVLKLCLYIA